MLDIVVPVYNEGKGILRLLDEIAREIRTPCRVLIVYDFDGDSTVPVVQAHQEAYAFPILLVRNSLGRGALNAIKTGMRTATEEKVLVVMADSSDRLDVVDDMCAMMDQGYDLVCGSRYMKGGEQHGGPALKRFLSRMAGRSLRLLSGIPTHDCTNSFKLYRRSMLETIEIESDGGFEIGLEILVKAHAQGYRIGEVPSRWFDREEGQSNFRLWKWLPDYLRWFGYGVSHGRRCGLLLFAALSLAGLLSLLFLLLRGQPDLQGYTPSSYLIPAAFGANIYALLILCPGLVIAELLYARQWIRQSHGLIVGFLASCLLAWAVWWIYLASPAAGRIVSTALMLLSPVALVLLLIRKKRSGRLSQSILFCDETIRGLNLLMLSALLYAFLTNLYLVENNILWQAMMRYRDMPEDNTLQYLLMEKLYQGEPLEPFFGDWLSSDRPPLLSALLLLTRHLSVLEDQHYYQFTGIALNCLCFPGLILLCRYQRFSARGIRLTVLIALFSGYFIQNTAYLWPKVTMIAPFCLLYVLLWEVLFPGKQTAARPEPGKRAAAAAICGAALAVCMLLHGGAAFTLIAFALVLLFHKPKPSWTWAVVLGSALLLYAPWMYYQKVLVPPGDRLLKYHLAGVTAVTPEPFTETIVSAYRALSFEQFVSNKLVNLSVLFTLPTHLTRGWIIHYQFFYFFSCFGVLIFGVLWLWKEKILQERGIGRGLDPGRLRAFRQVFFLSLALFVLLKFTPGTTLIHEGSPIAVAMLLLLIGQGLSFAPKAAQGGLFLLHFGTFVYVYALADQPVRKGLLVPFVLVAALLIFAVICGLAGSTFHPCFPYEAEKDERNGSDSIYRYEQRSPV